MNRFILSDRPFRGFPIILGLLFILTLISTSCINDCASLPKAVKKSTVLVFIDMNEAYTSSIIKDTFIPEIEKSLSGIYDSLYSISINIYPIYSKTEGAQPLISAQIGEAESISLCEFTDAAENYETVFQVILIKYILKKKENTTMTISSRYSPLSHYF